MSVVTRRWTWRLAAGAVAGLTAAAGFSLVVGARADATAFTPGQGYAAGQAAAVQIVYSSANLGFNVAHAIAQYTDGTGTATGAVIDSGIVMLLSELAECGTHPYPAALIPKTTSVSTNTDGNRAPVSAADPPSGRGPAGIVTVSAKPNAAANTEVTSAAGALPGLVSLSGGVVHAEATTGPSAATRTAVADVRDGDVSLLGGLIQLHGLHWTATVHVNGADNRSDHRTSTPMFEMGSVTVAGVTIAFPPTGDYATQLATLNRLTVPLGVQLRLPAVTTATTGGTSSVSVGPLTIAIGGKTLIGPALFALLGGQNLPKIEAALKPGVFDPKTCNELAGLLKPSAQLNGSWNLLGAGYPIIVAGVVASLDGGGELDVNLGGAEATVDDTYYPPSSFGTPGFATSPQGATAYEPGRAGTPGSPAATSPGLTALPTPARTVMTTRAVRCATASPVGWPDCWSGHAAAAGLGAAVLTVGLLAGDETIRRRRVRRLADEEAQEASS